ncbi:sequestosome-1 isoform X2 [Odontomachus brunneus]|uniref:sequestosome-1 isoform X2 n=1 Tax=Odontomachus brunneus TaxID=486640 RepID=UPI0013F2634C|nr:sequestosome-1 isoform X2 [Odontomachus brunneus]
MNKLSFKVYLLNEELNKFTEVRRFCLDIGVAKNFVALREKLQSIFPELHEKNFTVTWKDDRDTIVISTSEELEIALEEMGNLGPVNKLYVTLQSEKGEIPHLRSDRELHPGVVCDVCENSIRGMRFKCMQCPDYDLCTSCMTMGYHPEHFMVRMTEPVVWSSYYGRRLAHHMRKFMKKTNNISHNDKDKDDETRRCPYKSGSGNSSGGGGKRGGCRGLNMTGEETCHEQKRFKEQQRDPSTEAATEATEDPQQTNSLTQLLKMFEKNLSHISQFLDPLGINIVVTSDNDNSASKPAANGTPTTEPSTPSQSDTKFPGEGKKLRDDIPVSYTLTAEEQAAAAAMEKAVAAAEKAVAEKAAAQAFATEVIKIDKKYPATTNDVSSSSASPSPQATQKVGFREQIVDEPEWTVVGRESPDISRTSSTSSVNGAIPKQPTPSAPATSPSKSETGLGHQTIYPQLSGQSFFELDPKIQGALEAMVSMGFTNEGGWLTHLLISKDGDISKVLDVLQPVRR